MTVEQAMELRAEERKPWWVKCQERRLEKMRAGYPRRNARRQELREGRAASWALWMELYGEGREDMLPALRAAGVEIREPDDHPDGCQCINCVGSW